MPHLNPALVQEEIFKALAQEKELWQREHESQAIAMERERERGASILLRQAYSSTLHSKQGSSHLEI